LSGGAEVTLKRGELFKLTSRHTELTGVNPLHRELVLDAAGRGGAGGGGGAGGAGGTGEGTVEVDGGARISDGGGGGQGLTLVHFSAQPEPFLTQHPPQTHPGTPCNLLNTP
jgi:hypothetical protein